MYTNEKIYTSNLIASLTKVYNQSRLNGKLPIEDIYLLNAVYKLLNTCETALNDDQIIQLNSLYTKIINSSKYICTSKIYSQYEFVNKNTFIQAESDDCNTLPVQNLIYYWQEPLGVTNEEILTNIVTGTYLDTKPSDLKSVFNEGKDINYTNIGLICFALNNTLYSDKYLIYDDNEVNVNVGFQEYYSEELKTTIFISYNNYSYGIMNFKIKKV